MAKLTDTQLVILSAAAQHDDGAVLPLPKSLRIKGAAVTKTLEGLRKKCLLEEQSAAPDTDAWRDKRNAAGAPRRSRPPPNRKASSLRRRFVRAPSRPC